VYAVAFTHAELSLLLRVMRRYAEQTDAPLAADVLEVLEGAVDDRDLAAFDAAVEEVAP
jgi:hypothetical protein